MAQAPQFILIAGPNGAGKSTGAAHLVPQSMAFVNADEIARDLPGYPSPAADRAAARLLLERLETLEIERADFAVETTLASRSIAARVRRLRAAGYHFRLVFLYLPDVAISIERVARRVRLGGHGIPEATIRRRYRAGIRNFFEIYQPIADKWDVYDTIGVEPRHIAEGAQRQILEIFQQDLWKSMNEEAVYE